MNNLEIQDLQEKKILLVDDETEILNILEISLKREGFVKIYRAETGAEAIRICREINPDAMTLDVMLPDLDGFEVCQKIREFSFCPIIFLSARTEDFDRLLGLRMGGDDYMTKPFSPKEVAFKLKATLRRLQYLNATNSESFKDEESMTFGKLKLDLAKAELTKDGKVINLTAKEFQLLAYLIKHKGRVLSKEQLLDEVWNSDFEGYDNTLMVHIRNLRSKIETDPSKPEFIVTARGLGYKFVTGD
jgi:DNA-binding response OmpR family regulator